MGTCVRGLNSLSEVLVKLFFPPPCLSLFSYSIALFHMTLPLGKGMQMQKGPVVFNCMHWRGAVQLKCVKCLCLEGRGGQSHRAHPISNKLTPGCTSDRKRSRRWGGCWGRGITVLDLVDWTLWTGIGHNLQSCLRTLWNMNVDKNSRDRGQAKYTDL